MADEPKPPPGPEPTAQVTTKTEQTSVVTGSPVQPPPPAIIADDNARKWLAVGVILQFIVIVGYILYNLKGAQTSNSEMLVLGAENVFMTTVLNYYFGSSSGSTAKSAAARDKV
jgi:hypothetical protein